MDYILFDEFITLQALLKELRIIQSGGAIKQFLSDTEVYFNNKPETRRGKKLHVGDNISIPSMNISITITHPNDEEIKIHLEEQAEKERVSKITKEINKNRKQSVKKPQKSKIKNKKNIKAPIRFPGI